jgi:phytanoyl-CoA hydroxylase
MLGLFLEPDAASRLSAMDIDPLVKMHALEVVQKGYTLIKRSISPEQCRETIAAFRQFEAANITIFSENRDTNGHYPRIVNLHCAVPALLRLFTRNGVWLAVQDVLFGAPTALYTSLFYEVGSEQALHRDTPLFATRPEYLYFGSTVYLEPSDDENGCLEVLEYGHALPEIDREAMARMRYASLEDVPAIDPQLWVDYQDAVAEQGQACGLKTRKIPAEAGDSLIWHPQLPHGGSPIRDRNRTRFSLVMHNTPQGVPVYHQNVFFQPTKPFPETAAWQYRDSEGRKIADFTDGIAFSGSVERKYPLDQLRPTHQLERVTELS